MMSETPESVTLIPIDRIEVLNSRDRNMKVFEEIVDNIRQIGLKKPITVTERASEDGEPNYLLVCGEGRLNAFRMLGETHIPALVVDVDDEDAFIMSLAENIARRGHRPLEILSDIQILRSRNYSAEHIIEKTGLSAKYVKDIVFLLDQGEERLIEGVQRGNIPLTTALEIARASERAAEGEANLGDMLQEAYENGQLKGRQIIEAKRLIEKREELGPASPNARQTKPPTSSYSLVRTYQKEVERQRKMVLKAEHAHQRLLLVVQGLKTLFADEHFVNLLRAEQLDSLPKYLAEKIQVALPDPALNPPAEPETTASLEGASS
jgi:ParB family transcriptional regulator, chromosome partitioning protein